MSSLWKDTWEEVKKMVRKGVVLTEILPSSTARWDGIPTFQHSGWRGIRFSVTNYSATGHGLPHCEEVRLLVRLPCQWKEFPVQDTAMSRVLLASLAVTR